MLFRFLLKIFPSSSIIYIVITRNLFRIFLNTIHIEISNKLIKKYFLDTKVILSQTLDFKIGINNFQS